MANYGSAKTIEYDERYAGRRALADIRAKRLSRATSAPVVVRAEIPFEDELSEEFVNDVDSANSAEENSIRWGLNIAMIAAVVLISAILVYIIATNVYIQNVQYNINDNNAQTKAIQEDIDFLNFSIDSNLKLSNIESKAQGELGLTVPKDNQFVHLNKNQAINPQLSMLFKKIAYPHLFVSYLTVQQLQAEQAAEQAAAQSAAAEQAAAQMAEEQAMAQSTEQQTAEEQASSPVSETMSESTQE